MKAVACSAKPPPTSIRPQAELLILIKGFDDTFSDNWSHAVAGYKRSLAVRDN